MKIINYIKTIFGDQTNSKVWRKYIISVCILVTLFVLGGVTGFFFKNQNLMQEILLTKARSHFHNILLTRKWNSEYGGVFVEKKDGITSNPYLENPDIITREGVIYTKKNPALMTREISKLATNDKIFTFHITSNKPLNPSNFPDDFEINALSSFEKGRIESFSFENENGKEYFRYMAPLFVEDSCLSCHSKQGYKSGDIRGGISVKFDISEIKNSMAKSNATIFGAGALSLAGILGSLIYFNMKLMAKLNAANKKLEDIAITDALTSLFNRRHFFDVLNTEILKAERHKTDLTFIIIDIDNFKNVNDNYGHPSGDCVLISLAKILQNYSRRTDVIARFGGEEFVVLAPNTSLEGGIVLAEKYRKKISEHNFEISDKSIIKITASFGVTAIQPANISTHTQTDTLIAIADKALYTAKAEGRDRVVARKYITPNTA